jgi:hypothetical protein
MVGLGTFGQAYQPRALPSVSDEVRDVRPVSWQGLSHANARRPVRTTHSRL